MSRTVLSDPTLFSIRTAIASAGSARSPQRTTADFHGALECAHRAGVTPAPTPSTATTAARLAAAKAKAEATASLAGSGSLAEIDAAASKLRKEMPESQFMREELPALLDYAVATGHLSSSQARAAETLYGINQDLSAAEQSVTLLDQSLQSAIADRSHPFYKEPDRAAALESRIDVLRTSADMNAARILQLKTVSTQLQMQAGPAANLFR